MTRSYFTQIATEVVMFAGSGLFLAWYIWVKVAVWPWGAWSF